MLAAVEVAVEAVLGAAVLAAVLAADAVLLAAVEVEVVVEVEVAENVNQFAFSFLVVVELVAVVDLGERSQVDAGIPHSGLDVLVASYLFFSGHGQRECKAKNFRNSSSYFALYA